MDEQSSLTQPGAVAGTPAYMAPEQAEGQQSVDHRCDLFSLGCVMYRLLTGELPFQGSNNLTILLAVIEREPRPLSELSPQLPSALAELVMRLLAKRREDRVQSAREVVEALEAIERSLHVAEIARVRAASEPRPPVSSGMVDAAQTSPAPSPQPSPSEGRGGSPGAWEREEAPSPLGGEGRG